MIRTLSTTLIIAACAAAPLLTPATSGVFALGAAELMPAKATATLPTKNDVDALLTGAVAFLRAQQKEDGSYWGDEKEKRFALGFTQLALIGMLKSGVAKTDPQVAKSLAYMMTFRQKDGGFYNPDAPMGNYCTSLALQVLTLTDGDKDVIKAGQNYLFGIQNTMMDEKDPTKPHMNNGGIGYGSRGKGNEDLSNTSFAIQALRESGVPATEPRMQAALKYLERCQHLSSVNKMPWVDGNKTDEGGAAYSPDESKAAGSQLPAGASASGATMAPYGGMTYQLIASYVALDLKADDPRVKAALGWISRNWRLDANPGMPDARKGQGLFYYYVAMARTFDMLDMNTVTLPDGKSADWRADLFAAIKGQAKSETAGMSWTNSADRWQEGSKILVTAYVAQALARIKSSL